MVAFSATWAREGIPDHSNQGADRDNRELHAEQRTDAGTTWGDSMKWVFSGLVTAMAITAYVVLVHVLAADLAVQLHRLAELPR